MTSKNLNRWFEPYNRPTTPVSSRCHPRDTIEGPPSEDPQSECKSKLGHVTNWSLWTKRKSKEYLVSAGWARHLLKQQDVAQSCLQRIWPHMDVGLYIKLHLLITLFQQKRQSHKNPFTLRSFFCFMMHICHFRCSTSSASLVAVSTSNVQFIKTKFKMMVQWIKEDVANLIDIWFTSANSVFDFLS